MWARRLYSSVIYGAAPLVAWRLYRRGKQNPAYRARREERFGFYPDAPLTQSLWVHTVSVGEFLAAKPLLDWILSTYPSWPLVITTMTPTGSERVRAAYGERVHHYYLPYDFPYAVERFLDHVRPQLLVVMETELWPNVVHFTHARGVPVMVANARLSDRSARGYQRARWLTRPMLEEITVVAAQSGADASRFLELGLPPEALQVTGTVKFDLVVDERLRAEAVALREQWGRQRPVFIAASTHAGEDEQILQAFRFLLTQLPALLLVLVPRHPERFDAVETLLQQQDFRYCRHSLPKTFLPETEVVLGDTMGELLKLMAAADVAFVGGSLEPVGGHNMLEPLAVGVPAISGPHVFNFAAVAKLLADEGVLMTVTSPLGLANSVLELLQDTPRRLAIARKGIAVVEQHRGALQRLCRIVTDLLNSRGILPG